MVIDGEKIEDVSPLWLASCYGNVEVVSFLLSAGSNCNEVTKTNSTPLRVACFDGWFEVSFLLKLIKGYQISG